MADELDDGLLLEDELVAYSDDAASDAEASPQIHAPPSSAEDAATAKKRKRREQAKVQRRKVRGCIDARKQPNCRSSHLQYRKLRSNRVICRPTFSWAYSARPSPS